MPMSAMKARFQIAECSSLYQQRRLFRKPTFNSLFDPFGSPSRGQKPSLPLRKAPPLISVFSNGLYTPFGSPVSGGQKPQGRRGKPPLVLTFLPLRLSCKESSASNQAFLLRRKDVTALRCSEPLCYKVGGASKPCAILCGLRPHGGKVVIDYIQVIR